MDKSPGLAVTAREGTSFQTDSGVMANATFFCSLAAKCLSELISFASSSIALSKSSCRPAKSENPDWGNISGKLVPVNLGDFVLTFSRKISEEQGFFVVFLLPKLFDIGNPIMLWEGPWSLKVFLIERWGVPSDARGVLLSLQFPELMLGPVILGVKYVISFGVSSSTS